MPTEAIARPSASGAEISWSRSGAGAVAVALEMIKPVERKTRPFASRMKRVSLWKTGRPLTTCSTRTIRMPLPRLTLSPMKRKPARSPRVNP
jgi:hypothetical protein